MRTRRLPGSGQYALTLVLIAAVYYLSARLGLSLALVRGQVTPVWPPTGIALVALLIFGRRVWPAITVAALAVNLPIGPNPVAAACIAAGNTLAPLTAAVLLDQAGFRLELDRLRDAAAIIVLGALFGMAVSATFGASTLLAFGAISASAFAQTWAVWWTGDAMGVLLVAPFLLSLRPREGEAPLDWRGIVELVVLILVIGAATFVVFETPLRLEYLVFPLIMLAAFRFRLRGAAPAALVASGVAVLSAVRGTGPFASENLLEKMVTLQLFNVFVALASFVLASYVDTREREERMSRLYLSAKLANQAKNRFLQAAAHELRAPLTVISGYLTILSDLGPDERPPRWKDVFGILTEKTWELNRIMDQLLEATRLENEAPSGKQDLLDLRSLVEKAVQRSRAKTSLAGGSIAADLGSQPIWVYADADQIGLILDNLINNGLAYTRKQPELAVTVSEEGGRALVRVLDNGVGISEPAREEVFEPFRRGRPDGLEHVPGTGLGLYISRQFAKANQGSLVVERSAAEGGSTLTLSLPIHDGPSQSEPPAVSTPDRAGVSVEHA